MTITDRFNRVWEIVATSAGWVAERGNSFVGAKSKQDLLMKLNQ